MVTSDSPTRLRVASLNLWGWFGSWQQRLKVIVDEWPAVNADVLLTQEVCHSADSDQLQQLASAVGYRYTARAYAQDLGNEHGREGVAVLSRFPLTEERVLRLPDSQPGRCLLLVSADISGHSVDIACAHTAFGPRSTQELHLDALCRLVADRPRLIVGGDLNSPPELVLPRLAAMGLRECLPRQRAATWPVHPQTFRRAWRAKTGAEPHFSLEPRRIDYVAARGVRQLDAGISVLGAPERPASDHAVIWADYEIG
jgi:endonuclease/exonuclease/phosphatase family metal-dependent hydrolase